MELIPIAIEGEIGEGADLAAIAVAACNLRDLDVLVVTQKVVSKAEGRVARLADGDLDGFDALVAGETRRVLRRRGRLAITETHHGFVCANAGIDRSNAEPGTVTLLPTDPDRSARGIAARIRHLAGVQVAVIVTDTFGRAWRRGLADVAIGAAGIRPIVDLRGTPDRNGRTLEVTEVCIADEIAAAADLVKPKAGGVPMVVARGLPEAYFGAGSAADIVRPYAEDLFR